MTSLIQVERDDRIATVVLNKPDKMNAMDKSMWQGLADAFAELSADDELRCVVLRGAGGKAFSAGADIEEFRTSRANAAQAAAYGEITHRAMHAIAHSKHPTVAVIEGACVGGGLEIASVCDMRICGNASRFGVPVNKLGLVMSFGELGGLVNLVGSATALEIVLEGRVFDAREALENGWSTAWWKTPRCWSRAMPRRGASLRARRWWRAGTSSSCAAWPSPRR
jgi:enoyl-CoA hydratase